ncbi:bifunctional diguanylate cyclase/phosphodiesterase [Erythrobacter sp. JK5]|uniref:putative bifunctional diguanylate cyclase/phosphodiesterase n=1 Tax=Erythrobacter sp. JK5 TaxID=2829500 RepID=UPI001BA7E45D|nr:EAL domain-containing protein [Erythrobacter sp. JK5]QUL39099.1 EAL domain-containing protein [Erythrobacter sp. JK5]
MANQNSTNRFGTAERDLIALGIATGAIILFVATGSSVLPQVVRAMLGDGDGPDNLLVNALLLNIALIIFGWRRYRQLTFEISERRNAEAQARELAEIDPLTGCLNRRSMAEATQKLREDANAKGQAIAFVMIDLDNFKQINDMHGHRVGDAVLTTLAERICSQLPGQGKLARLGGDEFAFVVPYDAKAPERVDDLVIRLYERVTGQFELDGITIDATMSIGIATDHDEHGFNPLVADSIALMHRADIAMYHAKKQGKNRFFWFEPTMENELRFRNELESGIRRGLAEREFVPYYEQQIDLESGELVGFEMLARWHSPQLGVVSPEIFIPIAEEMGLIGELSDQLMARAFVDATEWDETLTLSINISPVQLRDPWFAQKLLKLLVKHGLPPRRLEVEITESCLHSNIGMVRSMITSLRNQGVQISLDDFGTGYSSLEQLRTLPFDRLKIDRSFVSELGDPDGRTKIVDAIISLGRGLNMPITAEGIEDEHILETLKTMGKLKGQGYLYGRPETAEQVRERLRAEGKLAEQPVAPKASETDFEAEIAAMTRLHASQ